MTTSAGRTTRRAWRLSATAREEIAGWLLASPWIIGLLAFTLGPMLASIYFSLTNYDGMVWPPGYVGLRNYERMLTSDPIVQKSIKVTLSYAFIAVPLHLTLALAVAVLLNQRVKALGVWRTIFYLPSAVSGVAVALLWVWLFNPEFGLVNWAIETLSLGWISGPAWLVDENWALWAIILSGLWGIGGGMLIYLAGLQGIPSELYEAAQIDGANSWQRFWAITIPQLSPVIFYNLVVGIVAQLQMFTQAYVMTEGGPNYSTHTLVLALYDYAFGKFRLGYASAVAWLIFALVLALTIVVLRSARHWVYYAGEVKPR